LCSEKQLDSCLLRQRKRKSTGRRDRERKACAALLKSDFHKERKVGTDNKRLERLFVLEVSLRMKCAHAKGIRCCLQASEWLLLLAVL
jgi:hypothetical protein